MGGNRVKIERLTDYIVPMRIMVEGGIYPAAFEDGVELGLPDVINEFYLGAMVEDVGYVGFYKIQQMAMHLYQGHANIMVGYRREYAKSASEAVLQWIADHIEGFETLIAMVPDQFDAVKKHVLSIGLQHCGRIPNAFRKNDEMQAIDLFVITKDEIKCRQQ